MRHQDEGPLRAPEEVDAVGHRLEGVDVQAGVGLVQDRQGGLQHGHLEDLGALLLPTRETGVHRAAQQVLAHLHRLHPLLGHGQEIHRVQLLLAAVAPYGVDRGAQEVEAVQAGNLHGILEAEEESLHRPQFRGHAEQVLPLVQDFAGGHLVGVTAGQHLGQRTLARAVGAHDGVDLAGGHRQVDAAEDLLALDARMQVSNFKHLSHPLLSRRCLRDSRPGAVGLRRRTPWAAYGTLRGKSR